jgi:hypothetical protein
MHYDGMRDDIVDLFEEAQGYGRRKVRLSDSYRVDRRFTIASVVRHKRQVDRALRAARQYRALSKPLFWQEIEAEAKRLRQRAYELKAAWLARKTLKVAS